MIIKVCDAQSSPGFGKCFFIHVKQSQNNMASFTHAGVCILTSKHFLLFYLSK